VCTILSCSRECPFSLAHSLELSVFFLSGFFCVVLLALSLPLLPLLLLLPLGSQHPFALSRSFSCAQYSLSHVIDLDSASTLFCTFCSFLSLLSLLLSNSLFSFLSPSFCLLPFVSHTLSILVHHCVRSTFLLPRLPFLASTLYKNFLFSSCLSLLRYLCQSPAHTMIPF